MTGKARCCDQRVAAVCRVALLCAMDDPARSSLPRSGQRFRLITPGETAASTAAASVDVDSYRRLADVFHDVLSEQSLDSLLVRIADTLAEIVPYEALHIYEADEAKRELMPALVRSEWASEILSERFPFGEGITGWAVEHREPVLANQAHLDPRVQFVPGTPVDPEALIVVPLIARGLLKGTLNVYRIGEDACFTEQEFELAQRFGDAAALALDNAHGRARLEHQAQTDSLTGLYNHRYFHERLRRELTRGSSAHESVALVMMDIDDFKKVNDVYGHGIGDQVLAGLADHLRAAVRSTDVVCRIGGEEFAVIVPAGDADARGRGGEPAGHTPRGRRARDRRQGLRLDRHRPGPRARRQPTRADRVRRGRDDDRQGARQEPGRALRRVDHRAARGARRPARGGALDRAPEDAPVARAGS